ncbi:MAG: hypothetical protein ACD_67C00107G0001, partial [uncultured bacterium]
MNELKKLANGTTEKIAKFEDQLKKSNNQTNINWFRVFKLFLILAFLPIVAVWYIWEKTTWSKTKKWIATAVIVFLAVFIFAIDS